MAIEEYRFNARKEDDERRKAKNGMQYCKNFIKAKLPFGSFRTILNENIFPGKSVANPGMIKFNTIKENEIIEIDKSISNIKVIDKKIFNNCYYVLIDCSSLPAVV
jgi:hypothetical protein